LPPSPLHDVAVKFDILLHFAAVRSVSPLQDAARSHISLLKMLQEDLTSRCIMQREDFCKIIELTPRSIMQRRDLTAKCSGEISFPVA
jgi:hypothetical protein